MYVLSPSGVEHATLDQGCSLLRSGELESARGTQAMIQHRGISIVFFFSFNNLNDWDHIVERSSNVTQTESFFNRVNLHTPKYFKLFMEHFYKG